MPYGIYVRRCCECGWWTINKKKEPMQCAACDSTEGTVELNEDVACVIANYVEIQSDRIREHAKEHGLSVYRLSKNRYVVLRVNTAVKVSYSDKEMRAYTELSEVAKGDWQHVMKYIRNNTPALPEYLR